MEARRLDRNFMAMVNPRGLLIRQLKGVRKVLLLVLFSRVVTHHSLGVLLKASEDSGTPLSRKLLLRIEKNRLRWVSQLAKNACLS